LIGVESWHSQKRVTRPQDAQTKLPPTFENQAVGGLECISGL